MRVRVVLVIAVLGVALGACAAPAQPTAPATPEATDSPTAPGSPETRIEVSLTDEMRIEPDEMTVPVGQPVTFVVTNVGAIDHEFFVGDEAAQQEHEEEMAMGGMQHDEEMGVSVAPGQTEELTLTFAEAGTTLAGCHEPGHYPAGMKATISVGQ
jgi:uncharacterized cupredoxin-like copper-binding protein